MVYLPEILAQVCNIFVMEDDFLVMEERIEGIFLCFALG